MTPGVRRERVRAHRRQFVLAPAPVRPAPDWVAEEIAPGLVLSRCPELRVRRATDASGASWTLLGWALPTREGDADPPDDLAGLPTEAVAARTAAWAGRWALIGAGRVLPDAGALLGCLYGRSSDGALLVTSSPALGRRLRMAAPRPVADPRRLVHERGVSWFPPPRTCFEGLSRLLPSQALDLVTGEPLPHAALPPIEPAGDLGLVVGRVAAMLSAALARLGALGDPVWLGLTAGGDSRAVLALAARVGADLRPHTRITPRMSVADRVMPPTLARAAGYGHEAHRDRPSGASRAAMLEAHAAGSVSEGDARPFLAGSRDDLAGVLVGGHGFEVATGFSDWRALPAEVPEPEAGGRAIARFLGEPEGSRAEAGLAAWLDWVRRTPVPHLDWRDRMYLEQRHAGWLAAKEQVYDMQDVARVPLLNAGAVYAAMLSLPEGYRTAGRLQGDLVRLGAPALAAFPVNPPDARFLLRRPAWVLRRRADRLARRVAHRLRAG